MTNTKLQTQTSPLTPADGEAIRQLKEAIASGKHWYIALLEAIGLWQAAEEEVNGRKYQYLIADEAFDWLLLAERLCQEVDGLLPEDERMALLFHGKPPIELTADEFKKLIGGHKYHQYLNYFYGITAEEALVQAVEEEVRKERQALGRNNEQDIADEVYHRIYGANQQELLRHFRREKKYPRRKSIGLAELKEFTYWLFKYRLKNCDKARVASDTKKALGWLKSNASPHCPGRLVK
ncbi:hypothetical protein ES703_31807 [subsurface metagenome]